MLYEINDLEEALLQDGQVVPHDIRKRLTVLRDFARTMTHYLNLFKLHYPELTMLCLKMRWKLYSPNPMMMTSKKEFIYR